MLFSGNIALCNMNAESVAVFRLGRREIISSAALPPVQL